MISNKCLVCIVFVCVGVVNCVTIDSQLTVITNDCFERLAIGHRLKASDVYKSVEVKQVAECQRICTMEEDMCKSFSFGVGTKGNTSCELSKKAIRETADLKPIGTLLDEDFDLYIKKLGCKLVIGTKPLTTNPQVQSDEIPPGNDHDNNGYSGSAISGNRPNFGLGSKPEDNGYLPDKPNVQTGLISVRPAIGKPMNKPLNERPMGYGPEYGYFAKPGSRPRPSYGSNNLDNDIQYSRPEVLRPDYSESGLFPSRPNSRPGVGVPIVDEFRPNYDNLQLDLWADRFDMGYQYQGNKPRPSSLIPSKPVHGPMGPTLYPNIYKPNDDIPPPGKPSRPFMGPTLFPNLFEPNDEFPRPNKPLRPVRPSYDSEIPRPSYNLLRPNSYEPNDDISRPSQPLRPSYSSESLRPSYNPSPYEPNDEIPRPGKPIKPSRPFYHSTSSYEPYDEVPRPSKPFRPSMYPYDSEIEYSRPGRPQYEYSSGYSGYFQHSSYYRPERPYNDIEPIRDTKPSRPDYDSEFPRPLRPMYSEYDKPQGQKPHLWDESNPNTNYENYGTRPSSQIKPVVEHEDQSYGNRRKDQFSYWNGSKPIVSEGITSSGHKITSIITEIQSGESS